MTRIATGDSEGASDPYRGRPLGRVLSKCGKVSREQVHEALAVQAERKKLGEHVLVGEVLVAMGFCTEADVAMALRLQKGLPPIPPAGGN